MTTAPVKHCIIDARVCILLPPFTLIDGNGECIFFFFLKIRTIKTEFMITHHSSQYLIHKKYMLIV